MVNLLPEQANNSIAIAIAYKQKSKIQYIYKTISTVGINI